MEELARRAGITVRTLRFYRERKLIPPPRREGRIAWYDDRHLARLRTITALLERGHTLNGIAELAEAFDHGRDVGELLGMDTPTEETPVRLTPEELAEAFDHGRDVGELLGMDTPTEETPVRLTPEELADHFTGEVTPENLAAAMDLGHLGTDGEEIFHISRRLLDVSSALVREGIPLAEVLRAGGEVRAHAEAMADLFAELILRHAPEDAVPRLRPLARSVVDAELSLAMDRRLRKQD
ncbi:MerR family transcriptional regulator [Streptomyces sp. M2CJ-2]|uniref:MerR family transcriptional regulator n=1 Tax=Streptomyces sp. M2CJ-2 TaxID=2803948 RepID=UPI00192580D3|nr:MerR family transcriptional regulator [Streptomyces sp. M2CJ-2]MBL3667563.1 MerR family transcriptional regulator [Streptomyces sp. M2CJ-2]